jgi:indole-3-glycerol phosphate synthase
MFLKQITAAKHQEIEQLYHRISKQEQELAKQLPEGRSLAQQLRKHGQLSIIAEVKPASPSKGVIRQEVDPVQTALAYERGRASAISVLTDIEYFRGKPESLTLVKQAVQLPVLRKDFILDPIQVIQSKLLGADALLLIVALLTQQQLSQLSQLAHDLGMEVLVEIHQEHEIPLALNCDADVIGINNRNLSTFETDLRTTEMLRPLLQTDLPVIAESGVHSVEDLKRLRSAHVDGVLIGEFLMRQEEPEEAVRRLVGGEGK